MVERFIQNKTSEDLPIKHVPIIFKYKGQDGFSTETITIGHTGDSIEKLIRRVLSLASSKPEIGESLDEIGSNPNKNTQVSELRRKINNPKKRAINSDNIKTEDYEYLKVKAKLAQLEKLEEEFRQYLENKLSNATSGRNQTLIAVLIFINVRLSNIYTDLSKEAKRFGAKEVETDPTDFNLYIPLNDDINTRSLENINNDMLYITGKMRYLKIGTTATTIQDLIVEVDRAYEYFVARILRGRIETSDQSNFINLEVLTTKLKRFVEYKGNGINKKYPKASAKKEEFRVYLENISIDELSQRRVIVLFHLMSCLTQARDNDTIAKQAQKFANMQQK